MRPRVFAKFATPVGPANREAEGGGLPRTCRCRSIPRGRSGMRIVRIPLVVPAVDGRVMRWVVRVHRVR